MALYDPTTATDSDFLASEGLKVIQGVGFRHWTNSKGTPTLDIEFVILRDIEGVGGVSKRCSKRFWLTPKAMDRFGLFCMAIGQTEPLDPGDHDSIGRLLARGALIGKVEHDTYKGKTRAEVVSFERYTGDSDPSWDAFVTKGEAEYRTFREKMEREHGKDGGAKQSGGQYDPSGTTSAHPGGDGGQNNPDDSIPF